MVNRKKRSQGLYPCSAKRYEGKIGRAGAEKCRACTFPGCEKIKREEGRTIGAMKEIEHLLGMEGLSRVEAFDISNINGFETVGSMIVYEKGKPKRSDYRKFKLKTNHRAGRLRIHA